MHDEKNEGQVGDVVTIAETVPISKLKTWKLVEIVDREGNSGEFLKTDKNITISYLGEW